ncbi:MAG: ABC transporter ATP-binding protein [Treponema sp.]|jgi:putative ABC transport system ATP-binding protein|nr:ABC transporter ATP-binding protein [Treponema sp.]
MITIENVVKTYFPATAAGRRKMKNDGAAVHALRGVSTEITDGEFTAIAGPSGSGKTTLLNLTGCLDSITSGRILIDGEDVSVMNEKQKNGLRQKKIGFIFQSYNLIPVLTAQENVELALILLKKYSKEEIRQLSYDILREVGLDGLHDRKPGELSGGQQQRISVARALVKKPAVILADEPTANLDSTTSHTILDLMKNLNGKYNTTFLFSTHDQTVKEHCRRIIYLKDGQIEREE